MPQLEVVATGLLITVSDPPVWVNGIWECGDQRFTDPTRTIYVAPIAYPEMTTTQFYQAFKTSERILLKSLAQTPTGLTYAKTAAVQAGGAGNAVGDVLTLASMAGSGIGQVPVEVTVSSIATGGAVTGVTLTQSGASTNLPSTAVAVTSTTGSGTGATFNLTGAAVPQDPLIAEFWATFLIAQQSNTPVNPNLVSNIEGLEYLVSPTAPTPPVLASSARIAQIQAGIAQ